MSMFGSNVVLLKLVTFHLDEYFVICLFIEISAAFIEMSIFLYAYLLQFLIYIYMAVGGNHEI